MNYFLFIMHVSVWSFLIFVPLLFLRLWVRYAGPRYTSSMFNASCGFGWSTALFHLHRGCGGQVLPSHRGHTSLTVLTSHYVTVLTSHGFKWHRLIPLDFKLAYRCSCIKPTTSTPTESPPIHNNPKHDQDEDENDDLLQLDLSSESLYEVGLKYYFLFSNSSVINSHS